MVLDDKGSAFAPTSWSALIFFALPDMLMEWLDWKLLLGILIGLVSGIVSNLLTPFVPSLWRGLVTLQRYSYHGQVRQKIKALQTRLAELERRKTGSDRDLLLYLTKWFLMIFAFFALAAAFAFIAMTMDEISLQIRERLMLFSLGSLIASIGLTVALFAECRYLNDKGIVKRMAKLEAEITKWNSKLPPA
jgi:hypothetical protein